MALIEGGKLMGVTEIQGELRKIQTQLSELELQLEDMKPKSGEENRETYKKINMIAEKYQIKNKALCFAEEDVRTNYVLCLGFLTMSDKNHIYDKLLFLMRIAEGINAYHDSEKLYQDITLFNQNRWENSLLILKNYRYSLIVDGLILSTLKQSNEKQLIMIAEVAEIYGISAAELQVCAMVAKAVITENFDILDQINKWNSIFLHYIPGKWLVDRREKCEWVGLEGISPFAIAMYATMADKSNMTRINCKSAVIKGEKVCSIKDAQEVVCKYARKDGIVYHVDQQEKNETKQKFDTYIVSYFDDYELFCEWYKNKK